MCLMTILLKLPSFGILIILDFPIYCVNLIVLSYFTCDYNTNFIQYLLIAMPSTSSFLIWVFINRLAFDIEKIPYVASKKTSSSMCSLLMTFIVIESCHVSCSSSLQ